MFYTSIIFLLRAPPENADEDEKIVLQKIFHNQDCAKRSRTHFKNRRNVTIGTIISERDMVPTSSKHDSVLNSLRSFEALVGADRVLILTEASECTEFTKSAGAFRCIDINMCRLNRFGMPTMPCIFDTLMREAKTQDLVFVNSDILLFEDFLESLDVAMSAEHYVMVGTRTDYLVELKLKSADEFAKIRCDSFHYGSRNGDYAIDYFAFSSMRFPVFDVGYIVGNWRWDNALLKRFYELEGLVVFDSSYTAIAVHQVSSAHEERNARSERRAGIYNNDLAKTYDRDFTLGSIRFADYHLYRSKSTDVQMFGPSLEGEVLRCVLAARQSVPTMLSPDSMRLFMSFLMKYRRVSRTRVEEKLRLCS